jgi:hypothetical protein
LHPIDQLIGKEQENKDIVADIVYIFTRDLHLSYREIKIMPLEDVVKLLKRWNQEQEKIKEANKKH